MTRDAFERLRQEYRYRAVEHVGALEHALAVGNGHTVANIAHKLNGSGESFGFPQVTALARPLELAAEEGLAGEGLRRLAVPLIAELTRIAQAV